VRDKERSSPSRWLTEKALDVWYGNKTMVDILFGGLSDAIERIAARPGRSADRVIPHYLKLILHKPENESEITTKRTIQEPIPPYIQDRMQIISRVDINFISEDNETIHTIQLRPQPDKKFERLKALAKKTV
ncbi:hypothetical protein SFRURICE_014793, partial [Spodoptera frugiperda]